MDDALDNASEPSPRRRDTIQGMRSSTTITNELAKAIEVLGKELAEQQRAADEDTTACSVEVEGAPQELHPILRDEVLPDYGGSADNAFRHARAQRIEVEIRYDGRKLRVRCGMTAPVSIRACSRKGVRDIMAYRACASVPKPSADNWKSGASQAPGRRWS